MPATSIDAQINYLAEGTTINRRFVAPADEANTGTYEPHVVKIGNARQASGDFTLDHNGFILVDRPTAVADFSDKDAIDTVYTAEVVRAVKDLTGADHVVPLGWMQRTSGDLSALQGKEVKDFQYGSGLQPPAGEAHVDMTPDRAERLAASLYDENFPAQRPFSRFIAGSFWRPLSQPPQDYPLALCDAASVGRHEGVPNTMVVVDKIPSREDQFKNIPGEDKLPAAAIFHHNPAHRWWYYPDMTPGEALLFKFHDSDPGKAGRVMHTAFHDPSRPDAKPRRSIELRFVAFFA